VLDLRHAVALGLAHGPAELLPVSSSAHTILIPWLAGWPDAELDPDLRKSFEVALHTGAAAALGLAMGGDLRRTLGRLGGSPRRRRRAAALLALSLAPPSLAGFALERPIERRLSGPTTVAAGLLAGALWMALADRGLGPRARPLEDAGPRDGLLLGLAQAAALLPGVSRNGATLATARLRGFDRAGSHELSWLVGVPVILAASALKARRLVAGSVPADAVAPLAAGAGAAFLSTLASARLLRRGARSRRLLPYSVYRGAVAVVVLGRLSQARRADRVSRANR